MRALTLALMLAAGSALACPAPVVIDGDTLACGAQRIRLGGIDAPELHQPCFKDRAAWPCGEQSRAALAALVANGITCTPIDRDRYGRAVARCTNAAGDVAEQMVRQGMAVDWPRYDADGRYKPAEEDAVRNRRGVWSSTSFDLPWIWRQQHRGMR